MMPINPFRFFLAQIGQKEEFENSRQMIISKSDFPKGDWIQLGEMSWRTGAIGKKTERGSRARQKGTYTFWRSFKLQGTEFGLWSEIIPYASRQDAQDVVPELHNMAEVNTRSNAILLSEREIKALELRGTQRVSFHEQETIRNDISEFVRIIVASVDNVAFIMMASGDENILDWPDVLELGQLQVSKIQNGLSNPIYGRAPSV